MAPRAEQSRIVVKLDELFSDITAGERALEHAALLGMRYRQSVVKAAVTGELTKDWRANNLARLRNERKTGDNSPDILRKRRETWEAAQLAKSKKKGKRPRDNKWKARYAEPRASNGVTLPSISEGWVWATFDMTLAEFGNGLSKAPFDEPPGHKILRVFGRPFHERYDADDTRYYGWIWVRRLVGTGYSIRNLLLTRYNGSAHLVGVCGRYRGGKPVLHPDKLMRVLDCFPHPALDPRYVEIAMNTEFLELSLKTKRRHLRVSMASRMGMCELLRCPYHPLKSNPSLSNVLRRR